jgi:hypothetical protein
VQDGNVEARTISTRALESLTGYDGTGP